MEVDAAKIITNGLAVDRMILSGIKDDSVLGNQASLVKYMKAQNVNVDGMVMQEHADRSGFSHCNVVVLNNKIVPYLSRNDMPVAGQQNHQLGGLGLVRPQRSFVDDVMARSNVRIIEGMQI